MGNKSVTTLSSMFAPMRNVVTPQLTCIRDRDAVLEAQRPQHRQGRQLGDAGVGQVAAVPQIQPCQPRRQALRIEHMVERLRLLNLNTHSATVPNRFLP